MMNTAGEFYGHGSSWLRGPMIGKEGEISIYMVRLKKRKRGNRSTPLLTNVVVKSAEACDSVSLMREKLVLESLQYCLSVIRVYGEEITTTENGGLVCNVLIEHSLRGTMADLIEKSGGCGMVESEVKRHTKCLIKCLNEIHLCGYVHCNLNPESILVVSNGSDFDFKISEFGYAKRANKPRMMNKFGSNPKYNSPETVNHKIQEQPSDIWAIGCIVLELLSGKSVWGMESDSSIENLMRRIGSKNKYPIIPNGVSNHGKNFLRNCFKRNPVNRLTAKELLNHPFLV